KPSENNILNEFKTQTQSNNKKNLMKDVIDEQTKEAAASIEQSNNKAAGRFTNTKKSHNKRLAVDDGWRERLLLGVVPAQILRLIHWNGLDQGKILRNRSSFWGTMKLVKGQPIYMDRRPGTFRTLLSRLFIVILS
ncbi:hypothetical protein ACJX0J_006248, partial [Zea mays]